jgi:phytoene/squalene synthetase
MTTQLIWSEAHMAVEEHKNWRELCNAATNAKDPDELMRILQEFKKALKHEEQVLRDFWDAMRANKPQAPTETAATQVEVSIIQE